MKNYKRLTLAKTIIYIIQSIFIYSSIIFALGLIIFWLAFKNDFLCLVCILGWAFTLIIGLILFAIKINIDYKIIELELKKQKELISKL